MGQWSSGRVVLEVAIAIGRRCVSAERLAAQPAPCGVSDTASENTAVGRFVRAHRETAVWQRHALDASIKAT